MNLRAKIKQLKKTSEALQKQLEALHSEIVGIEEFLNKPFEGDPVNEQIPDDIEERFAQLEAEIVALGANGNITPDSALNIKTTLLNQVESIKESVRKKGFIDDEESRKLTDVKNKLGSFQAFSNGRYKSEPRTIDVFKSK